MCPKKQTFTFVIIGLQNCLTNFHTVCSQHFASSGDHFNSDSVKCMVPGNYNLTPCFCNFVMWFVPIKLNTVHSIHSAITT